MPRSGKIDCASVRSALAGQHDVVAVAEHERLRSAPDDLLQVHHRPHPKAELPQQQVLDEVVGQAPGPERQLPVADRPEADPAQLEDEKVGAEKIITPILEEGRDAAIIVLAATRVE